MFPLNYILDFWVSQGTTAHHKSIVGVFPYKILEFWDIHCVIGGAGVFKLSGEGSRLLAVAFCFSRTARKFCTLSPLFRKIDLKLLSLITTHVCLRFARP